MDGYGINVDFNEDQLHKLRIFKVPGFQREINKIQNVCSPL